MNELYYYINLLVRSSLNLGTPATTYIPSFVLHFSVLQFYQNTTFIYWFEKKNINYLPRRI